MKFSTVEKWISGIGFVAIVGAAGFIMVLEYRVSQLEDRVRDLRMGPRGENCQQIVGKLVERPDDKALKALAMEWGCAWMPAHEPTEQGGQDSEPITKFCPDGSVVLKTDKCLPSQ